MRMKQKVCRQDVDEILDKLEETFPEAKCELNFGTPFQLLVATILSAQATDKTVNKVTPRLFAKYPTPQAFLEIGQEALEDEIREIGLYRSKAKNILAMCAMLLQQFRGEVPRSMEELTSLPGVGRKTANVVMSNAFGIPALAVDTHVFRVSNRIGLAKANNVEDTEEQLMQCIDRQRWSKAHHLLIWHGRRICMARNPHCSVCPIQNACDFYKARDIEGINEKLSNNI